MLKPSLDGARWVSPHNVHLTLKFLGPTTAEQINDVTSAIEQGSMGFRKFSFSLGDLGGFPSINRARVLWVGVRHGERELIRLNQAIEKALAPLGFEPEEKQYRPHITLARFKTPKSIADAISKVPTESLFGRFVNVDGITIFQSRLKRSGAEYEPLRHVPLQG